MRVSCYRDADGACPPSSGVKFTAKLVPASIRARPTSRRENQVQLRSELTIADRAMIAEVNGLSIPGMSLSTLCGERFRVGQFDAMILLIESLMIRSLGQRRFWVVVLQPGHRL